MTTEKLNITEASRPTKQWTTVNHSFKLVSNLLSNSKITVLLSRGLADDMSVCLCICLSVKSMHCDETK